MFLPFLLKKNKYTLKPCNVAYRGHIADGVNEWKKWRQVIGHDNGTDKTPKGSKLTGLRETAHTR